ncbi:MAG TPA: glutamate synthase subunit alpha, partial [Planctomycetaceae bacterium]|nr:glutamate synthase subunit alpha [Planctomycetaceae bacterium]
MNHHSAPQNPQTRLGRPGRPKKTGLYDPRHEHDACGIGFIANITGEPSRQIIIDAERILRHMDHRGGCGCDANTGDGAGMLTGLPFKFLRKVARNDLGLELPADGQYGVGNVFLPHDESLRAQCKQLVEHMIAEQGQTLLGWRHMPIDPAGSNIGKAALDSQPHIEQLFIAAAAGLDKEALERQLFIIAKRSSNLIHLDDIADETEFYICSLSTKVIIYKGMLTSGQV